MLAFHTLCAKHLQARQALSHPLRSPENIAEPCRSLLCTAALQESEKGKELGVPFLRTLTKRKMSES